MERSVLKGYNILTTGDAGIPVDNEDETKDIVVTATLKLLNKTAYNRLVLAQEDMICFQIIE